MQAQEGYRGDTNRYWHLPAYPWVISQKKIIHTPPPSIATTKVAVRLKVGPKVRSDRRVVVSVDVRAGHQSLDRVMDQNMRPNWGLVVRRGVYIQDQVEQKKFA